MRLVESQRRIIGGGFVHLQRWDGQFAHANCCSRKLGTVSHALIERIRHINAILRHLQTIEDKVALRIGDACQCDSFLRTARVGGMIESMQGDDQTCDVRAADRTRHFASHRFGRDGEAGRGCEGRSLSKRRPRVRAWGGGFRRGRGGSRLGGRDGRCRSGRLRRRGGSGEGQRPQVGRGRVQVVVA